MTDVVIGVTDAAIDVAVVNPVVTVATSGPAGPAGPAGPPGTVDTSTVQAKSEKDAANGYAGLDSAAKVPFAQTHITVASTAPGSPATNDVWIDTT